MTVKSLLRRVSNRVHRVFSPEPPDKGSNLAGILNREAARWKSARAGAKGGPRVLIPNSTGLEMTASRVETMLAAALTLRGAEVHLLLCDRALPACWMSHRNYVHPAEFAQFGPSRRICGKCFSSANAIFNPLGLPSHRYSKLISSEALQKARALSSALPIAEIAEYRLDGMAVGEHALAGAVRFFARGNLDGEPHGEAVLRRYFQASLLTISALERLINTYPFQIICALHGIYVPEGAIGEVARGAGVRVVNWQPAYRKHSFLFSHHDTYHHTLLSEPTSHWENMEWTAKGEDQIVNYLKSRWYGTRDWIGVAESPQEDVSAIAADLGLDSSKPWIGMLTNVMWDAQIFYGGNAFSNMLEWTLETIRYFASRPDLQLIIRVHPAELRGALVSRQPIVDEIKKVFPTLPKNVFLIPPDSSTSTYAISLACDAVIIYGTKTGVELTSIGIPVIVAGEAWIRNKGITLDASSREEYFRFLDRLPLKQRLSEPMIQRARKYAYHYFFRRMIPLPFMVPTGSWPPYELKLSGLDDLLPGRSVGLDVICDGILNGGEFIYPAELDPETFDGRN
jgi:Capsule polysaccharide biosynthesis protein